MVATLADGDGHAQSLLEALEEKSTSPPSGLEQMVQRQPLTAGR